MEGLRVVGKPEELAEKYAQEADELLYIDTVASLYGRNQLEGLLERTTDNVFIPITVGGGIRSVADVRRLLNAGADKIAVNTAAIRRPALINEIAGRYGNQCVVVSIEAKRTKDGWEAYTDNGRERTGIDAIEWAEESVRRGAGEILITSIDQDGTRKGFDLDTYRHLTDRLEVPVTACGGMGTLEHARQAVECADALAMASVLHYNILTIGEIREHIEKQLPHKAGRERRSA